MTKKHGSEGFTLIEMALVLVLGGLMLGTVLKGQMMVESFKMQRLVRDLQSMSYAFHTYFTMYNALPGDDANNHGWASVSGGNNDGRIDGNDVKDGNEVHEAWQALRRAGLIIGNPDATDKKALPGSPYGGHYSLGYRNFSSHMGSRNCILATNINSRIAESVDIRHDDGIYNSGSISASDAYTSERVDLCYSL